MKHTQKYTDEPLGRLEVIDDFLPPPDQLVLKEDGVKITISAGFSSRVRRSQRTKHRIMTVIAAKLSILCQPRYELARGNTLSTAPAGRVVEGVRLLSTKCSANRLASWAMVGARR